MVKFKWALRPKPKNYVKAERLRFLALEKTLKQKYGVNDRTWLARGVADGELTEDQSQELQDFMDWYYTDAAPGATPRGF